MQRAFGFSETYRVTTFYRSWDTIYHRLRIVVLDMYENTNTKSWFKNNLGRLLCKELQIRIGSSPVYDNKLENLVMVYKDLWLPDERREDMSEYGIATENLRKLMSGDDSASTSDKADNALFKACGKRIKIKLGKILNNPRAFCA